MNKSIHSFKLPEIKNVAVQMYKSKRYQELFEISCMALERPDADHIIKVMFSLSVSQSAIAKDNPLAKEALLKVLLEEGIEYQNLRGLWRSTIELDPQYLPYFGLENKRELSDDEWEALQGPLASPLLLEGIKKIRLDNETHERILTNLRRITLLNLLPSGKLKTKHLSYICALAEQCFYNEYAYYLEDDEKEALSTLPKDDVIAVAILSCYEPLHKHNIPLKFSPIAPLKHILKIQIADYIREQEIKKTIPRLGQIEDDVSQNVQAMYEQNPYPRWRDITIALTRDTNHGKVLVAGCGTGKFTTQIAYQFKDMDLTAIDISTSSIAYAKRMAEEYNIKNLNFIQCDILNIDELPENYDFINCSGVLHHMKDPIAGWNKLIGKLNPGGVMLIGLYSTAARVAVEEAHQFIKDKNYKAEVGDIQKFRRNVYDLPLDHPVRDIVKIQDFYTTSEVRDLVFHVQEKTYSIPELQETLDGLGLEFMGFRIRDPKLATMYKENYPDDPNMLSLKNWHDLEKKEPKIFLDMYNFWCKRKNDKDLNPVAQEIFGMDI